MTAATPLRRVGFTGTQVGMTPEQLGSLRALLEVRVGEFRHGDCVGADEQAHSLAVRFGWSVVVHPPVDRKKRALCRGPRVTVLPPRPYLARNDDIVKNTDELIAAPRLWVEELRSGTWTTIRRARKAKRPVTIIWPDGRIESAA